MLAAIWPYIECFSTILVACELLFCLPILELRVGKGKAVALICAFLVLFNSRNINNIFATDVAGTTAWSISLTTTAIFAASVALIYLVFSCTKRLALFYAAAGYATENLIFYVRNANVYFPGFPFEGPAFAAFKLAGSALVAYIVYAGIVKRYPRGHEPKVTSGYMLVFVVLTLLVTNVLSTWARVDHLQVPLVAILSVLCNLMLLMIEFDVFRRTSLEQEQEIMQRLMVERERQQRLSQENIDLINMKCHDLKHQIAALRDLPAGAERDRVIGELEQAVLIYDSAVHTGNASLDTVLTEKSLTCESRGIEFSCIIDEGCLAGMDAVDLCTLFGNALDNAIEATAQIEDPDARLVSLHVKRQGSLARITVENSCKGEVELGRGLPQTTKGDAAWHGFGLKSIKMIAERYGGNMVVASEPGRFTLKVLLPAAA